MSVVIVLCSICAGECWHKNINFIEHLLTRSASLRRDPGDVASVSSYIPTPTPTPMSTSPSSSLSSATTLSGQTLATMRRSRFTCYASSPGTP
ncbi:unnamed protein product [Linum trigynum]|uniref:Secreted protein n=1 Tax=Linum trigynum TaxID=586398 RepID=A0AAV2F892_9ROSI